MLLKRLAINNYETSNINIFDIPKDVNIKDSEQLESYITERLNFSLSNIDYFIFTRIVQLGKTEYIVKS